MWLGNIDVFAIRLLSMALHEAAHILAGVILLGQWPKEFRIMPWGFYLDIDMEFSPLWKRTIIALAGPVANMLLWLLFSKLSMEIYAEMNLTLMLFNLLPVLPLDGGLLAQSIGLRSRLPASLIRLQELAPTLLGSCIVASGILQLSLGVRVLIPILCGVALLTPRQDKGELIMMGMSAHMTKRRRLRENRFIELRTVAVNEGTEIQKIAEHMPRDTYNIYCILTDDMTPCGYVSETQLLDAMLAGQMEWPVAAITNREPSLSNPGLRAPGRGSKSLL